MTWTSTYTGRLTIAVDMLTASIFWNRTDTTVSSLCGIQLRRRACGQGYQRFLAALGDLLNWLNPNHCEGAILGDFSRMMKTVQQLGHYIDEKGNSRTLVLYP